MTELSTDLVGSVEAAELAGVAYSTFMRWVKQGRVPAAHVMPGVSGAKLYRRADIEALAAELSTEATA
jgi:predicted site-specific integrase-resolvase